MMNHQCDSKRCNSANKKEEQNCQVFCVFVCVFAECSVVLADFEEQECVEEVPLNMVEEEEDEEMQAQMGM